VREDNQSCIAMAKNPKFTPQTKHIAIKYHHFLSMLSLNQIPMGSYHLSIAPQMIKSQISLLSLFGMIFSSSLERVYWGGD
jgi:hypothetical protein